MSNQSQWRARDDEQIFWINEQTGELVSNESFYGHVGGGGGGGEGGGGEGGGEHQTVG